MRKKSLGIWLSCVCLLSLPCSSLVVPPGALTMRMRRQPSAPGGVLHFKVGQGGTGSEQAQAEADALAVSANEKAWEARRKTIRSVLFDATRMRSEALDKQKGDGDGEGFFLATPVAAGAFTAVVTSVLIRAGGRGALLGTLGIGMLPGSNGGIDGGPFQEPLAALSSLTVHQGDPASYAAAIGTLAPFWIISRVLMLDYLAIPLAFISGVVFQGVILGGVISAGLSTVGSAIGFGIGRFTPLGSSVVRKISSANPVVDGIGKVVDKKPIETVLVGRLAPILPIPIGGYNYVYGCLTEMPCEYFCFTINSLETLSLSVR